MMDRVEAEPQHESCRAKRTCVRIMSRFLTHHPCKFMTITLVIILLITIIGALAGSYTLTDQSAYDWANPTGRAAKDNEALTDAENEAAKDNTLTRQLTSSYATFWVTFDYQRQEDIFTPQNVQTMCRVEQQYLTLNKYPDFCVLNGTSGLCAEATNTISYQFYGTSTNSTCALLSEESVNATASVLYARLDSSVYRSEVSFFMDKDTESRSPRFTTRTRSQIPLGAPIAGYDSPNDDIAKQEGEYLDFYRDVADRFFNYFGLSSRWLFSAYRTPVEQDGLRIKYFSNPLVIIDFADTIIGDFLLAFVSIVFVFGWMTYQMRSFFLSGFAMLQIILSIPVSIVIYREIFTVDYFSFLHILVIFLVLGIGADDVFVFYDGWRQAAADPSVLALVKNKADDIDILERRMSIAYLRTLEAVFNTSFTTIVAFMATAISPIAPISSFGILAATTILMNFILVITLFPATLMNQHNGFVRRQCPCYRKSGRVTTDDTFAGEGKERDGTVDETEAKDNEKATVSADNGEDSGEQETALDKFATRLYIPGMTYRVRGFLIVAATVVIALLIYAAVSVSAAAQLGPPEEPEQWLPPDNMLQQVPDELQDNYIPGELDQYIEVDIPFGIQGFERPNFNPYKPAENRGNVVFDNGFDFYPAAAQNAFLYACDKIRTTSCSRSSCQASTLIWPSTEAVECFLPEFQRWFTQQNPGLSTYNCTRGEFFSALRLYRNTTISDGLSNAQKQKLIGFAGQDLRYVRIDTYLSVQSSEATIEQVEVRKLVDNMINDINSNAPGGMNNAFGASWAWVSVESELGIVEGFFNGLIVCFPVAFAVLVIATHNLLVSFYAIVSIGFIVACVLGLVRWTGGALGIAESVAGVIVVGFSVDYVIHLGHMFVDALHSEGFKGRGERFHYAAKNMVPTVIAGAVTTFGAALPLFACQLTFFPKMGMLMATTIAFSLIYSIAFFMGLCLLIGPEGRVADIDWIAEKIGIAPCLERCGLLTKNPKAPTKQIEASQPAALEVKEKGGMKESVAMTDLKEAQNAV